MEALEALKIKIIQFLLNRFALGWLVKGWTKVKGYKTPVFTALMVLTWIGEVTGQIPTELAQQLYTVFGTGAGISFLQKLQRYEPVIKEMVEKTKKAEA